MANGTTDPFCDVDNLDRWSENGAAPDHANYSRGGPMNRGRFLGIVVLLSTIGFAGGLSDTPVRAAGQEASSANQPDRATFTKDVAPILQRACQNCHRPGA